MKLDKPIASAAVAALFTAVITILSQIAVYTPFSVPVTLQIAGVALAGFVLGAKWGVASVATYILLGLIGVPVFSGFKGGAYTFFGATGGFIWGFLILVFLCGLSGKFRQKTLKILLGVIGVVLCHICGILQYAFITEIGIWSAFLTASVPFLIKDFILVILSFFIAQKINGAVSLR